MNLQINQLVKSLLQKETLEQCSLQELEQFADRHPYFGAAQLLLTKKLQLENPERYDEQLQKTFLFFNNPLWVQHLLNETGNAEIIVSEKKQEPVLQPIVNEPVAIATVPEIHNNKEEFTNPALTAEPTIETVTEKQLLIRLLLS